MIEDDNLLKKYNTIWDKVSADIIQTKIKFHGDKVTDFYKKEIPKVNSNHIFLAVISWEFTLKKDENHFPVVMFLKECKYIKKDN